MGLKSFVRGKIAHFAALRIGKELSMGAVGKFLKDHKKTVGSVFAGVASWVWWQECGVVAGIDVLALLQRVVPSLICLHIQETLQMIAALLLGMGISDPQEWISNWMGLAKARGKAQSKLGVGVAAPGK